MISSKNESFNQTSERHGGKDLVTVQETVEKVMNLKVIMNLIKQSKYVLRYLENDAESISDTISILENKVNKKIKELKLEIGLF